MMVRVCLNVYVDGVTHLMLVQYALASIIFAILALSGCSKQQNFKGGELQSTRFEIGVSRLPNCDPSVSSLSVTSVLGVYFGKRNVGVGYLRSRYACIPEGCKVVVWVDDDRIIDEVRARLGDDLRFCGWTEELDNAR